MPWEAARTGMSSLCLLLRTCIDIPYWLLTQAKSTGRFTTEARLNASWNLPSLDATSPTKQTTIRSIFYITVPSAAPTAMGMPPPTTRLAPRFPAATSTMCMQPRLPLHKPVASSPIQQ
jgi:hypothetical protein